VEISCYEPEHNFVSHARAVGKHLEKEIGSNAKCFATVRSECMIDYLKIQPIKPKLPIVISWFHLADYPALSVDRAGGGNPLYAEDTPNQEFLIWCAPIQEFLNWCVTNQDQSL